METTAGRAAPAIRRLLGLLAVVALAAACSEGPRPTLVDEPPRSLAPTSTTAAPAPEPPPVTPPTATTTTAPEPEPSREWTLLAGGDVLMDRTEPAGIDPFQFIEPSLAAADIAVVNVEMAISDRGTPAVNKRFVFRAPPGAAERIAAAGIDVANLANNHARDYGADALLDTVTLLETAGVVALGAGADDTEAYRHRVLHAGGDVRVAFLGASMILPRDAPAGPDWPGIASARPTTRIVESVRAAALAADVVVVVIHWGVERLTCPTAEQFGLARELLDAGADVVIGQHPHVLEPVEFIGGKLVAYSLGNFVWHPRSGLTGETGVLQIDFDADRIVGWTFHPHLLDVHGVPHPVDSGTGFDRILDIVGGDCARHNPPPTTTTTAADADAERLADEVIEGLIETEEGTTESDTTDGAERSGGDAGDTAEPRDPDAAEPDAGS